MTDLIFDEEIISLKYTDETEGVIFAQIHTVLVLGMLEAKKPFDRLLKGVELFGEDDDYYRNSFLYYLQKAGKSFSDVLIDYFLNQEKNIYDRMLILEGMERIVRINEDDSALKALWEDELNDGLNAFAIFALVDITREKHIDLIRKVFEEKPVDLWYDCDLEDLEIRLGLREKRSTPRPRNEFGVPLGGWENELLEPYIASKKV